jgi:hypothetical protein
MMARWAQHQLDVNYLPAPRELTGRTRAHISKGKLYMKRFISITLIPLALVAIKKEIND